MKNTLYLLLGIFLVFSCSTNNEGNTTEAPIPPTNLVRTNISPTQVDLSWTDNSNNETGFKIERRKGTDTYAIVGSVNADITTFSDTNLTPSTTYAYKVYAYNANLKSPTYSNEVNITTSPTIVVPTLTTTLPSSLTTTTVSSGGNIQSDGGATIIARGVVWSTSTNPTVALTTKTTDGIGTGTFTSAIIGLTPSSTYYLRAYATNSIGTGYGDELSFTTGAIVLPTVSTTAITNITTILAVSGGNITADGGGTITARGVVWSTSASPTIALNTKTADGTGIGTFVSNLMGFSFNTKYYVRAYATNSIGTAYGDELSFITSNFSSTELNVQGFNVTDIDGNVYQTVKNCDQTWTKTNLNVSKYRNGDIIPEIKDPSQWANLTTGAWCYYNNDSAMGAIYGKLYNWYAVNDPRGLAPIGYHIPSDIEWRILTNCLGGEIVAGGKMKETASSQTDAYSWYYDSGATNSSGFFAKPASWRYTESSRTLFGGNNPIKMDAIWWSSTGYVSGVASLRNIQATSNSLNIQIFSHIKSNGLSIRCVKD